MLQYSKEDLIRMIETHERERQRDHELLRDALSRQEYLVRRVTELEKDRQQPDGYHGTSSWISKIVFALQNENKPLRSPELIRLLEQRESVLAEHHNKVQYFSAFLSNAVNYGRVVQQKVKGVRGYYYLLPEWIDGAGQVKAEYKRWML